MKFKLGTIVKDKVTGFTGVAENCATYLYGCDRYCVQPKIDKEGKIPDSVVLDVFQLDRVDEKTTVEPLPFPDQVVNLGDEVHDPISDMTGIATGRCLYLNGCARIYIETKIKKGGEIEAKGFWTDELSLTVKKKLKIKSADTESILKKERPVRRTGGPGRAVSQKY